MTGPVRRRTRPILGGVLPVLAISYGLLQVQARLGSPAIVILWSVAITGLVVNLVWSWLAVRRADVAVLACPSDVVVGDRAPCEILVIGVRGEVTVTMTSSANAPSVVARHGDRGSLAASADFRGVAVLATFTVTAGRPFGWVGFRRTIDGVPLPQPLVISPRPMPWPAAVPDPRRFPQAGSEELKAVRPFLDGDPLKLVHWPTTARSGQLAVRELEHPRTTISVVVDLGDGRRRRVAEAVAGGAAWVVAELLADGWTVRLVTAEAMGAVAAIVDTPLAVGRRLAVAVPGRPVWAAPAGEQVHVLGAA